MAFTGASSGGRKAIDSSIVSCTIACVVVLLRFVSKFGKTAVTLDDWLILLALALFLISMGVMIWGNLSVSTQPVKFYKSLLINSCLYPIETTLIKISILTLYRRVFITPAFRKVALVIGTFTIGWFMAVVLVSAMTCIPPQKFWAPKVPGHCINFNVFSLANGVLEMVIDSSILFLPIPMITRLKLSRGSRIGLCVVFLLGGLIIITGIIRLKESYVPNSESGHVDFDEVNFWSFIHVCTGILCASFPTYRLGFVIKSVVSFGSSMRKLYGSYGDRGTSERDSSRDNPDSQGNWVQLERYNTNDYDKLGDRLRNCGHLTDIRGGTNSGRDQGEYLADKVVVARTVEVI